MAANNIRSADVELAEKRTILQQLAQLEMKYASYNTWSMHLSAVYVGCTN